MVRLTAQLINMSAQKHNPIRDWELDLRGYRIPVLENLGATLDQFDTIDMTDNDIRKLDKFPLLQRLKCILLNNNRIVRIAEDLQENLPNLESLMLTNNNLKELSDIDPLSPIITLQHLSLLGNPVVTKKNYRLYVIFKIPSLRILDFCRIKQKERDAASKMFKKKKSQQTQQSQVNATAPTENGTKQKTFTPGEKLPTARTAPTGRSKEEVDAIKKAIANSKTLEEVERLRQMLMSGHIPGEVIPAREKESKGRKDEQSEEEEDEDGMDAEASGYSREMEELEDD